MKEIFCLKCYENLHRLNFLTFLAWKSLESSFIMKWQHSPLCCLSSQGILGPQTSNVLNFTHIFSALHCSFFSFSSQRERYFVRVLLTFHCQEQIPDTQNLKEKIFTGTQFQKFHLVSWFQGRKLMVEVHGRENLLLHSSQEREPKREEKAEDRTHPSEVQPQGSTSSIWGPPSKTHSTMNS